MLLGTRRAALLLALASATPPRPFTRRRFAEQKTGDNPASAVLLIDCKGAYVPECILGPPTQGRVVE
ncbi:hypothetical protein QQ25_16845 [Mycolicibacterium setense]|nr:hypothetical protein QQ25_16845 [Mycolicibacterium setense]